MMATTALSNAASAVADAAKSTVYDQPREPQDWLAWEQVEKPVENEEQKIDEICQVVRRVIDRNTEQHLHGHRATHVKGLGYVKGTFTVKDDLPDHLCHGLFKIPGKQYPVIGRYANEPSHIKADTEAMPRGFSMKLFNVEGERIDDNDNTYGSTKTQDIMMNNAPMLELTDLDTTLEIFSLREKYWRDPIALKAALAKRSDTSKQMAPGMLPSKPILGMEMFSQSAFRYGPYVAHFSLVPVAEEQQPFVNASQYSSSDSYTVLKEHVESYYAKSGTRYTFRAQFSSDLSRQPVEDASTAWDPFFSPWHDLATVEFPSQDTYSDARRSWWDDRIALSPFNGLKEHTPLGSVNRLRKKVYETSRQYRTQKNGYKETPYFPDSVDDMPQ